MSLPGQLRFDADCLLNAFNTTGMPLPQIIGQATVKIALSPGFVGDLINELRGAADRIEELEARAKRAEEAIKGCPHGPCPTLARLGMEDLGWE